MDHNGSGRLPAMAGPVKSGLLDDQDRVGGARLREGEQTLELQSGEAAFLTPNSRCELAAHGQAYVVIASNH